MTTVAVVGLGYVGLPLALEFGRHLPVIGYDRNPERVQSCRSGVDPNREATPEQFAAAIQLQFTDEAQRLAAADFVIVAVPTPVDRARQPDFGPLVGASAAIGAHLKRGATVVYESTVYPGATEEVCVPELERHSGMRCGVDFHVAYSPERVNPGDPRHTLTRITKLVAADDPAVLEATAALYERIIEAGVRRVPGIRVAEAAKVIENTQRDLNIALVNELAVIFHRLGLDTVDVLEAAGTKWNFLPFRPGLVGGHCIGVDPYYLTYKAQKVGYHPRVILAGRHINDGMGKYVAEQTVKEMSRAGIALGGATVNVLGLTFKENCPDLRNSLVADVVHELAAYGLRVRVHDPLASAREAHEEYGIELTDAAQLEAADAIVLAVPHREFLALDAAQWAAWLRPGGCFIDVKSAIDREALAGHGYKVWRL